MSNVQMRAQVHRKPRGMLNFSWPRRRRWRKPGPWPCLVLRIPLACILLWGVGARAESGHESPMRRWTQVVGSPGGGRSWASSLPGLDDLLGTWAQQAEEAWSKDLELEVVDRLLGGEQLEVLKDMAGLQDLDTLWANPSAAYKMLQGFPMFRVLSGVGPIMDKAEEDLTPEDGLAVLTALRQLADRGVDHMTELVGQTGLVRMMQDYASSDDPSLQSLYRQVEAGDQAATQALHDRVFEDLWGGVLEQEEMGSASREPEVTALLRRQVMEQDPDLWRLITQDGDPLLTQILEDPTSPARAAQDLATVLER